MMQHHQQDARRGRLIYLIGASGSGKDSLMRYARARLGNAPVLFAHRYITRPPHAETEEHVSLSTAEFTQRREAGLFALHWQAHGFHYGIGIEIDAWMARGMTVVVNGARRYLDTLRQRYPDADVVWVQVAPTVREARLASRAREDAEAISGRLQAADGNEPLAGDVVINNDGPLEIAGDALVACLRRAADCREGERKAGRVNAL